MVQILSWVLNILRGGVVPAAEKNGGFWCRTIGTFSLGHAPCTHREARMIRPLLLAPVLFLNTALAAEQTFISCDFTTLNRANALPPYLQLDNSGSRPSTINIIPDAEVAGNAIARMILQHPPHAQVAARLLVAR